MLAFFRAVWMPLALAGASAICVLAFLARSTAAAPQVIFTVESTLDYPDDLTTVGTCHTVINKCTLRAAVMQANRASGAGTTIIVPSGTFRLTIPAAGGDDELTGDLNLTNNVPLLIQGAGASFTVVDANRIDRIFNIAAASHVTLTGMTLRNGFGDGGAIANTGHLALLNSAVLSNTGGFQGGGISNDGIARIVNTLIAFNSALYGGGISIHGDTTLSATIVSSNTAAFDGAGIDIGQAVSVRVLASTLFANHAGSNGGAVRVESGGAALTVTNSTLSGNFANGSGGAIAGYAVSSDWWLSNVTIADNQADADFDGSGSGGGVATFSHTGNVANSIIADNFASACVGQVCFPIADDCDGVIVSSGYNLIESTANCTINGAATGDQYAKSPLLGPLANNGGPTPTRALLRGSPAIDAGNPSGCADGNGVLLATDQRGANRRLNARCDSGAYEYPALLFAPLIRR